MMGHNLDLSYSEFGFSQDLAKWEYSIEIYYVHVT